MRLLLAICGVMVSLLAFVYYYLFLSGTLGSRWPHFFCLLLFSFFGLFLRSAVYSASRSKSRDSSIFSPIAFFPIVFVFYFGLGMLGIGDSLREPVVELFDYYFTGLFSFFVGSLMCFFLANVNGRKVKRDFLNTIDSAFLKKKISVVIWGIFLISLFSYMYLVVKTQLGFLTLDFASDRVSIVASIGGYFYYMILLANEVIVLLLVYRLTNKQFPFNRLLAWMMLFACFVMLLSLGSRTRVMVPVVGVAIFFTLYGGIKFRQLALLGSGLIVFLVGYGAIRASLVSSMPLDEAILKTFFGELTLATFTFERIYLNFPDVYDFLGLNVVAMPFSALLPGSQVLLGNFLKDIFNLSFIGGGFTPTMIGSLYLINGSTSIALGMIVYGALLTLLYISAKKNRGMYLLIYALVVTYSIEALKGGFFKDIEVYFHLISLCGCYYLSNNLKAIVK